MTEQLRDLLHDLGDDQPAVRVDPGTFAAGRRAHRRGVAARAGAAVAVVAALAVAVPTMTGSEAPQPADGKPVPALPSALHDVPSRIAAAGEDGYEWHEDVAADSLEIGPTAAVFPVNGGAVAAVSALDGNYRGLKLPGFDEDSYFRFESTPVALSPDGTRLAYTWNPDVIDGDDVERDPATGVRIADLVTGEVTDHGIDSEFGVYTFGFGWSPDGRYLAYNLQRVANETGLVSGRRSSWAERLDTRTGERIRTPLPGYENDVAVADDGSVAMVGGGYNAVWRSGPRPRGFEGDFADVALTADGARLALGSWQGGLAVGDAQGVRREVSGRGNLDGDLVRTRPLTWLDDGRIAVLDLGDSAVYSYPRSLESFDRETLLTVEPMRGSAQLSLATGLLDTPTRDYPAPDWPTDWSSLGLWLRLSALVLVPLLLLAGLRRLRPHLPSRRVLRP